MVSSEVWTAVAAWIACTLTAAVAGPDLWDRMHGAKIEISQPRQLLLYRDGNGDNSVLWLAFDTTILNRSRFPDTTRSIVLRLGGMPGGGETVFRAESLLQPIFSTSDDDPVECPTMTRCIRKKQMTIGEERADGINVSAGNARSLYIGFPLTSDNCMSDQSTCSRFWDFDNAAHVLGTSPNLSFTLELSMADDGLKSVTCTLAEATKRGWPQMLERAGEHGWTTGNCD